MARKKTTITESLLDDIEYLASAGAYKNAISKVLDFNTGLYSRNTKVNQAFQRGESKHRKEVIELWHESLKDNGQDLDKTARRLGLFQDPIQIKKPTTIADAKNLLGDMIVLYGTNQISQSQLKTFESTCKNFVELIKAGEIELEVRKIKDHLDIKGN